MTTRARAELEAVYRNALFRVVSEGKAFTLRIGQTSPELDLLLGSNGVNGWAYVTACNPGSARLSPEENATRTDRLREAIARMGLTAYPGEGSDPAGRWSEASFLVVGLDERAASELGRQFDQLAIVVGEVGSPARLLWLAGE